MDRSFPPAFLIVVSNRSPESFARTTAVGKRAGYPDGADRIQLIRIKEDASLDGLGRRSSPETMGQYGVGYGLNLGWGNIRQ